MPSLQCTLFAVVNRHEDDKTKRIRCDKHNELSDLRFGRIEQPDHFYDMDGGVNGVFLATDPPTSSRPKEDRQAFPMDSFYYLGIAKTFIHDDKLHISSSALLIGSASQLKGYPSFMQKLHMFCKHEI